MQIRRCEVLIVEPREHLEFDVESLFAGGDGLRATLTLVALAPHLERECDVDAAEVDALARIPATAWTAYDTLCERHTCATVDGLVEKGLLICDDDAHAAVRARDELLRGANWRPLAAAHHYFGRWQDVRSGEEARRAGYATMNELAAKLGAPPPHVHERVPASQRLTLIRSAPTAFDDLLRRRATCRNFRDAELSAAAFSTMLHRVFGAQGVVEIQADNIVIKRTSPSGGGLHPTEAYLVVRRVEGVAPGLYHYHPVDHALEPMRALDGDALRDLVLRSVAAQHHFANVPVLVVMVCRFPRSFWKYRNHAKAYRVVTLDVGHLSQTLYLSATDLGLGAFVTSAINEIEIEQAFGLDPLVESALAVCGFGERAATRTSSEFDPARQVWNDDGTLKKR